jgi:hypothetical protein
MQARYEKATDFLGKIMRQSEKINGAIASL